jgi:D-arabinose 1-dehydrogenase-like Zn-dependent alcohol dehydrogenase
MKALVYGGPGQKTLEERPKPQLKDATDAIIRITKTTICGTDLHILKGDVPTVAPAPCSATRASASSNPSAPASPPSSPATGC